MARRHLRSSPPSQYAVISLNRQSSIPLLASDFLSGSRPLVFCHVQYRLLLDAIEVRPSEVISHRHTKLTRRIAGGCLPGQTSIGSLLSTHESGQDISILEPNSNNSTSRTHFVQILQIRSPETNQLRLGIPSVPRHLHKVPFDCTLSKRVYFRSSVKMYKQKEYSYRL